MYGRLRSKCPRTYLLLVSSHGKCSRTRANAFIFTLCYGSSRRGLVKFLLDRFPQFPSEQLKMVWADWGYDHALFSIRENPQEILNQLLNEGEIRELTKQSSLVCYSIRLNQRFNSDRLGPPFKHSSFENCFCTPLIRNCIDPPVGKASPRFFQF